MKGWILLHRKCLDHWLYNENRPKTRREAWEDMLLLANHSGTKIPIGNELIDCKRGQSIRSLESWAKHFKWTKSKVKRFFDLLVKDNMIETENLHKTTRITICKYDDYQNVRNRDETQNFENRNTGETDLNPNNKEKNKELIKNKTKQDGNLYFTEI